MTSQLRFFLSRNETVSHRSQDVLFQPKYYFILLPKSLPIITSLSLQRQTTFVLLKLTNSTKTGGQSCQVQSESIGMHACGTTSLLLLGNVSFLLEMTLSNSSKSLLDKARKFQFFHFEFPLASTTNL